MQLKKKQLQITEIVLFIYCGFYVAVKKKTTVRYLKMVE